MTHSIASTFACYVPGLVLRTLRHGGLPPCPSAESYRGAILLVDVSGFTRLAEALASGPGAGAEQLSRLLNDHLGRLVALVERHGGDVLKFAGDAFLAVWTDGVGGMEAAVRRASACALEMQRTSLRESPRQIELRIGIGAGEVVIMHLGTTAGHREIAVGGAALVQLTSIEPGINAREVVLTHQAWSKLGGGDVGTRLTNGAVRLDALDAPPIPVAAAPATVDEGLTDSLRPYVPPNILPRIIAGQKEWLAEPRQVTVLFIKVPGLSHTVSPEGAQRLLAPIHRALERFEGSVNNISSDDKGINVLAIFGLPPLAHEDDAARATSAAIALEGALHDVGLLGAIGLATGRAFCGLLGSETRLHYAVLGDVVNRAAHLMVASADGVLCDAATYEQVSDRFGFEEYPPITIKGRSEPLAVHRPLRASTPRRAPSPPLVGRFEERRILRGHLERLSEERRGGVVILEGEAGIGKSRVVEELCAAAALMRLPVLRAAAESIEATSTYHSWRSVFSSLLHLDILPDVPQVRRYAVLGQLSTDETLLELASLLNPLLGLDLPESDLVREMDDEVRARSTQDLLLRILERAVAGPTLLVLEDVHWLDSASAQLTRHASERIASLLVVMTSRPTDAQGGLGVEPVAPSAEVTRLVLNPLSRGETKALIAQCLGLDQASDPLVELIHSRAEGNPFFTEELVHALSDAGVIGRWTDGEYPGIDEPTLGELSLPGSLQGVIVSRIDRLPPGPQLCLKVASVIGRQFSLRTLRSIHPIHAESAQLEHFLTLLRARDLVQLDRDGADGVYRFKHAITQEATYDLLPLAQREGLHRSAAEWYEAEHAADLTPVYPILVHHWRGAGNDAALGRYLDLAGRQALSTGAYREAIGFLTQAMNREAEALDRHQDPSGRLRWAMRERQIGEAYYGLGRLTESDLHLKKAIAVLDRPIPASGVPLVAVVLYRATMQLLHLAGVPRLGGRGRSAAQVAEACMAYERLAELAFFLGENVQILYDVLGSVDLAEAAGVPAQVARSYAHVSAFLDLVPIRSLARRYEAIAIELAESQDHLGTRAHVYQAIGLSSIGLGQLTKAHTYLSRAAELFEKVGHRRKWIESGSLAMAAAYHSADLAYFEAAGERLLPVAAQSGGPQARRWFLYDRARLGALRGRFPEALEAIDEAIRLRAGSGDPSDEFRFHALKAVIHLRAGQAASALAAARVAVEGARTIHSLAFYAAEGFAELAEVCVALVPKAEAVGTTAASLRHDAAVAAGGLRRYARLFPLAEPAALRVEGMIAWERGRRARAARAWRKSRAAAERLGMPLAVGRADLLLASHPLATAEEQREHLNRALLTFEALGADYWAEEAGSMSADREIPATTASPVRVPAASARPELK